MLTRNNFNFRDEQQLVSLCFVVKCWTFAQTDKRDIEYKYLLFFS